MLSIMLDGPTESVAFVERVAKAQPRQLTQTLTRPKGGAAPAAGVPCSASSPITLAWVPSGLQPPFKELICMVRCANQRQQYRRSEFCIDLLLLTICWRLAGLSQPWRIASSQQQLPDTAQFQCYQNEQDQHSAHFRSSMQLTAGPESCMCGQGGAPLFCGRHSIMHRLTDAGCRPRLQAATSTPPACLPLPPA